MEDTIPESTVVSNLQQWLADDPTKLQRVLDSAGFAVFDGGFGREFCEAARDEIRALFDADMLKVSGNKLIGTKVAPDDATHPQHVLLKPQVLERDIVLNAHTTCAEAWPLAPALHRFFELECPALTAVFNQYYPSLRLRGLNQFKVQLNTGDGGCFPLHYDTSTATSDRELTLVLYLNPLWTADDHGEVRLLPFPFAPVDVPPLFDRFVVFCSHTMLHRVLPSYARSRYCLSLWFGGEPHGFPAELPVPRDFQPLLAFLNKPQNRMVLSKIIYRQEWERSLYECFGRSEQVADAVAQYNREVTKLESRVNPSLLALLKEHLPLAFPLELPIISLRRDSDEAT